MTHKVFISYASADKGIADAVCGVLEAHSIKCWYAPRDVTYGQDFDEEIVDAICASRLMILILSSHSNKSAHVKREIQNACMDDARVPILPFRVEDLPLNKSLRYYIGAVHWLDAVTPPLESHLKNLVRHVEARLPRTAQLPALTEAEARPESSPAALDAPPRSESLQAPDETETENSFADNLVQADRESSSQAVHAREEEEARRIVEVEARRRNEEAERKRQEGQESARKQQAAEEDAARWAIEDADNAARLTQDQQDALLRRTGDVPVPGETVEARHKELLVERLGWLLLAVWIISMILFLIGGASRVAILMLPAAALVPITILFGYVVQRIRSGKKDSQKPRGTK